MKIIEKPNLADYSSIHIGGLGNFLYLPETESELIDALRISENPFIFGGGTNIIFADSFQRDVVTLAKCSTQDISFIGNKAIVSAGVKLSRLVYEGARQRCSGCEVLAGIPGTIGGAVVMNAGSKYGDIGQYVTSVRVYSKESRSALVFTKDELEFGYRTSILQNSDNFVVLSVELSFPDTAPEVVLQQKVKSIINERIASTIKLPNCGSVFKNTSHQLSVGAMVDELGLKGYGVGGLAVSEIHGNIFVNIGDATYNDFVALRDLIGERVLQEYGVELDVEIRVML